MRTTGLLFLSVLSTVPGGYAADAPSVPVLGWVVQSDPLRVQAVAGAAGAALLTAPIPLPDGLTALTLAPGQTFGLAETSDGQCIAVLPLSANEAGSPVPIAGAFSHASRIAFSPSGTAAALYSDALRRIQIVSGLPDAAQVTAGFDLDPTDAALTALAAADDGTVLAGFSEGQAGTVYRISSSGRTLLMTAGVPAAIRLLANTDNALVVDSAGNQVTLLEGVSGTPTLSVLAGSADGLSAPGQIEIVGANAFAVINGSGGSLFLLDLKAGGVTSIPVAAPLTAISGLPSRSEVVLSNSSPGGLWLFGLSPAGSRLTFLADAGQVVQ